MLNLLTKDFHRKEVHLLGVAQWLQDFHQDSSEWCSTWQCSKFQAHQLKHVQVDRYIFGQSIARYDSPAKFFVHFQWMMSGGNRICECINCKKGTVQRKRTLAPPPEAPTTDDADREPFELQLDQFVDLCEQNPDVVHRIPWEEDVSREMLTDGQTFKAMAKQYQLSPSYLPRKGELVLFYPNQQLDAAFDNETQLFRHIDHTKNKWCFPSWKAGVVAKVPKYDMGLSELSTPASQITPMDSENMYRIELYPHPDEADKSLSFVAEYVVLRNIRPFNLFQEMLSGIPSDRWHETIHHALLATSTVCPVEPYAIEGQWVTSPTKTSPREARIECRGVWLGAELFIAGDAVRVLPYLDGHVAKSDDGSTESVDGLPDFDDLLPESDDGLPKSENDVPKPNDVAVSQVMIIDAVDWIFHNIDNPEKRTSRITVRGKLYTTNREAALRKTPLTDHDIKESYGGRRGRGLPSSFAGYTWYPDHQENELQNLETPQSPRIVEDHATLECGSILGRLYESEAMKVLVNTKSFAEVSTQGIVQAREWSKHTRKDVWTSPKSDFIFEWDRVRMLRIESLNEKAVGQGRLRTGYAALKRTKPASRSIRKSDSRDAEPEYEKFSFDSSAFSSVNGEGDAANGWIGPFGAVDEHEPIRRDRPLPKRPRI